MTSGSRGLCKNIVSNDRLGKNTILTAFTSIRQNKSVFIEIGFTLYSQWHNQPLYICDQNANRSNIVPHVGPNSEAHSELVILIQASVTPSAAKSLLDKGYTINVERSPARIFKDEEFEAAGATLVPEGSWVGQASTADILLLT